MEIYKKILFAYFVLIFIWIIIFIIQIKFLFLFIIAIINRLFVHFFIIVELNYIGAAGAKALAKALKLNKNLTNINLHNFLHMLLQLFTQNIKIWHLSFKEIITKMYIYKLLFTYCVLIFTVFG